MSQMATYFPFSDKSLLRTGDLKWYYFCPREKKYGSGNRLKRATEFGYWKTTGKDRPVHYEEKLTGMIKTLVFHQGKAPVGKRTDWVMHEYRLEDEYLVERNVAQVILFPLFNCVKFIYSLSQIV